MFHLMSFCLIEFIKNSVNAGGLFTKNSLKETNYWEICRNECSVLRCSLNVFKEKWQHRTKAILHLVFESKTVTKPFRQGISLVTWQFSLLTCTVGLQCHRLWWFRQWFWGSSQWFVTKSACKARRCVFLERTTKRVVTARTDNSKQTQVKRA